MQRFKYLMNKTNGIYLTQFNNLFITVHWLAVIKKDFRKYIYKEGHVSELLQQIRKHTECGQRKLMVRLIWYDLFVLDNGSR